MATAPEKQSATMKNVIAAEQLQMEIKELQRIIEAECAATSEENEMKCLARLFRSCLLFDSFCPRINSSVMDFFLNLAEQFCLERGLYRSRNDYPDEASYRDGESEHMTTVLQLLGVLPVAYLHMAAERPWGAVTLVFVALKVLEDRRSEWETMLNKYGLSANEVEEVLRLAKNEALHAYAEQPEVPANHQPALRQVIMSNIWSMKEVNPTAPWICGLNAQYQERDCHSWTDSWAAMRKLSPGLKFAEEQKDDLKACPLQWMHCHLMLLTGSHPVYCLSISNFLEVVQKARKTKARLDAWGEFRCLNSGGWTPVQSKPLVAEADHYWRSLAVAAHFKENIKRDPAFADTELPTFTEEELDKELVHVRCHKCKKLSDDLLRCATCQQAKYCSKKCQKKHWTTGHKYKCKAAAADGEAGAD